MDVAATTAVENNRRLFTSFARKLSQDDLSIYSSFAHKFAQWLSDPRAYYPEARPEIINLLNIAHTTFRRNVGADPIAPFNISSYIGHPMVEPYSRMLRAVHPYREHFVEPNLRAQIKFLLRTITAPPQAPMDVAPFDQTRTEVGNPLIPPTTLAPAQQGAPSLPEASTSRILLWSPSPSLSITKPTAIPSTLAHQVMPWPPSASPVNPDAKPPDPSAATHPASSVLANGASIEVHSRPAMSSLSQPNHIAGGSPPTVQDNAVHTPQGPQNPHFANVSVNLPPVRPSESNPITSTKPNLPAKVPAETSKLRKKKKKLDVRLDSLIQADIQQLQKRSSFSIKQELMDDSKLLDVPTSKPPDVVKSAPPEIIEIPDDADIAPMQVDTQPANQVPGPPSTGDTSQGAVEESHAQSLTRTSIERLATACEESLPEAPYAPDVGSQAALQTENTPTPTEDVVMSDDFQAVSELIALDNISTELDQQPNNIDDAAAPSSTPSPAMSVDQIPMEVDLTNHIQQITSSHVEARERTPVSEHPSEVEVDATLHPQPAALDIFQGPELDVERQCFIDAEKSLAELPSLAPDNANSNENAEPVSVNLSDLERVQRQSSSQPHTVETSMASSTIPTPPIIEDKRTLHGFGPEACILTKELGHSMGFRLKFDFQIPEQHTSGIKRWKNRGNNTEDLTKSICYTLSCYPADKTPEEFALLPSIWPTAGDLCMRLMYSGKRTSFPLSPPLGVSSNGMVDLSDFLSEGTNFLEIVQSSETDTSANRFVLRAHHPTRAQLEQVAVRRQKDRNWKDWLLKMSQPFDVPIPLLP